ncbi:hypothetical protein ETU08_08130 [Apibacter muscae]|uniref:fibronectin type III domain-containing protein n=1 Tax=Apibacter muscae TaxID=2509004 RepID=UPI0011ACBC30|nr:hypothetical protein [Apibacter muscae]TWP29242.1 hypothetical protein ETU08_08130 [Apibacter muscae]
MKKIIFSILAILSVILISAQEKKEASLRMIVREQSDQILLRWAVDQPMAWQKANEFGYILEKYLFSKEGKILSKPKFIQEKLIKAEPLSSWEKMVMEDDNAAIIAQGLYGESFLVEAGSSGKLADIVNLSEELEQRYSFSLLAADMNFAAAVKAGWGYIDKEIKKGEVYIYKIKTAVPEDVARIKGNSVIGNPSNYHPLPAPTDIAILGQDKSVLLTWEYQMYKDIYTTYNIQKSEDGINFKDLSETPLVNVYDTSDSPAKRMYYIDTLAQNDRKYYYRVYGISPFGEKGENSKIVSGSGVSSLQNTPAITSYEFTTNENEAVIEWEFPKESEKDIEKFQLNRSSTDQGPYIVIADNIPVYQRKITYSDLQPTNYLTITAVGKAPNQKATSYSTFIQPIDSIPPVSPIGLKGTIDSLGVVKITWEPNQEKDVLGYRIFRANIEGEEFSQITVSPIKENLFIDSVQVASLNPKVYYRLVAVDQRFNNSDYSETLVVEKPKLIPPTSPVFSSYKIEDGKVNLSWITPTEDGITLLLERRKEEEINWDIIFQTKDTLQNFIDEKAQPNKQYVYRLKAVNNQKLEAVSPELTLKVINLLPENIINEITPIVNREKKYIELFWSIENNKKVEIVEFTLYKKDEATEPTTWKVLPGKFTRVVDTQIYPGKTYTYYIRAILSNGAFSNVKTIEITY